MSYINAAGKLPTDPGKFFEATRNTGTIEQYKLFKRSTGSFCSRFFRLELLTTGICLRLEYWKLEQWKKLRMNLKTVL